MKKIYALLFAIAAFAPAAPAQVFFDKAYTNIFDLATARETSDGGFIVSGTTDATGTDDLCMMKTDASGNAQWVKAYGNGTDDEYGGAAIQTLDGGYALAGTRNNSQAFLVKTNAAGVTQWHYKYDLGYGNGFQDIRELADSSYILTYGSTNNAYIPGFCRIDKNGTVLWYRTLFSTSFSGSHMNNIIPLSNGDFLAVGSVYLSSSTAYEAVVRFNSAGTIVWSRRFGYLGEFIDGCETSDGNVVITGILNASGTATKIDLGGNLLWRRTYTFTDPVIAHSVAENSSGELLLFLKAGTAAYPAIIVKTNAFGSVITSREMTNVTYPGSFSYSKNSTLRATSDGGFVLATESHLKKITADLTSTCGIAAVTITNATNAASQGNQTYTMQTVLNPVTAGFIEIPVTSVVTSNCSTTILSASTSSTNPACSGQCTGTATATAAGGQAPYTYLWSPGGQTTSSVSNLCAGTYTVTVTDANSSIITSTVTITQPSAIAASASAVTSTFCNGGCTDLNINATGGTPAYSYLWTPGGMTSATPNVCPGASTTYTCTVTDANNCAQTATVAVTVNPLPNVTASIGDSICAGNSANLASNGASTYAWDPGNLPGSSVSVSPGATTTYTVTGTDVNGCTNTATTTITVHLLPVVSYVESQTTACVNWTPFTLSAGSPAGGMYSGTAVTGNSFDPAAVGNGTHDIVYTFTDSNGCAAADTSQITVDLCTTISEAHSAAFKIYPNPAENFLNVESGADLHNATITIASTLGETVRTITANGKFIRVATDDLPCGIYFLQIRSGENYTVMKFVKGR